MSDRPTTRPDDPRVGVVLPVLDEADNLRLLLPVLSELGPIGNGGTGLVDQLVVVDGGSSDDSLEVVCALAPDAVVVEQPRSGKGNALVAGLEVLAERGLDIGVTLDVDGSADPHEIEDFRRALLAGADYAKGSRLVEEGGSEDLTPVRAWGNRQLTRAFNLAFDADITDLCYGYNALWLDQLPLLDLPDPGDLRPRRGCGCPEEQSAPTSSDADEEQRWGDGFEIETLLCCRFVKADREVVEVPSFEHDRVHGESHLSAVGDGLRVIETVRRERQDRQAVT